MWTVKTQIRLGRCPGWSESSLGAQSSCWLCHDLFVCLCWGLTSQSTIFQSYWDGATASWVINQYFRGVKCLAQGHNTAAVGLEPPDLSLRSLTLYHWATALPSVMSWGGLLIKKHQLLRVSVVGVLPVYALMEHEGTNEPAQTS